jgi:hypothetical protein
VSAHTAASRLSFPCFARPSASAASRLANSGAARTIAARTSKPIRSTVTLAVTARRSGERTIPAIPQQLEAIQHFRAEGWSALRLHATSRFFSQWDLTLLAQVDDAIGILAGLGNCFKASC